MRGAASWVRRRRGDQMSDTLGADLELEGHEVSVGSYSADLVSRDVSRVLAKSPTACRMFAFLPVFPASREWRGLSFPGWGDGPVTRVAVFIDYQNAYHGARKVFGNPPTDPPTMGHVDPLRLGLLLTRLGEGVDPERELSAVTVYRGQPGAKSHPNLQSAFARQVATWERTQRTGRWGSPGCCRIESAPRSAGGPNRYTDKGGPTTCSGAPHAPTEGNPPRRSACVARRWPG